MPHTVSSTFANRYKPTRRPKFAKELETLQPEKNYFFKSPLLKILKTRPHNPTKKYTLTMTANINVDNGCRTRTTRTPACNSTLPKVAVQCFVGQFCGYINFNASYESECLKSPPSASCKPIPVVSATGCVGGSVVRVLHVFGFSSYLRLCHLTITITQ